ncbi:putative chitinase/peptidoglycan hydrolase-like protein with peptidoglycan-binding domain [Luteibacter jiangsuensis]|uniref:Chitinase/peptidoglycan hydrolase-like protein with peptidoglycan-binding domain n=1 Tax=Luteibacter jiangsuensis TaxID=637577 RepID=A0ABT9SZ99_9GAMM|nr:peptidoglycan-binding protein [Luteibacter jiangsuensis]MDQ0010318.1 putative chitinase/peptidoglycan hydrolase-like protein with peptidoglycan-binding domain [Luteibacter jiangsuensis]
MSAKENADYLMDAAMKAGITDPKELSNFMGQMQVESGGYSRMTEGLGYSGSRLLEVFPGRNGMNTLAEANKIAAGGPEAIANEIYGGAWGKKNLGNTEPGDGWTFHGRGYVQLTGRAGYEKMGKELGLDLVKHPELAEDKEVAARIAIQYWKDRVQANGHQTDVDAACKDINGGHNGLGERRNAAEAWQNAIEKGYKPGGPEAMPTAKASHGMSKEKAEHVQTLLNAHGYTDSAGQPLKVDGHAGKETRLAIERFQTDHHLKPDGVVGPATLKALEQTPQRQNTPSTAPDTGKTAQHATQENASLRAGANGPAVEALQRQLSDQGYVASNGRPPAADADFGPQTKEALQAFQRAHGLEADGIAGPKTLRALDANRQHAGVPSLDDASHPSNGMYRQALDGVQRLDAQHGRASGPHTSMIAGSLTAAAVTNGMQRIDHVALSDDASRAYAMQGDAKSPFKQVAEIDVLQAARTPLAQSSVEAMPHNQTQAQAQQHAEVQVQSQQQGPLRA